MLRVSQVGHPICSDCILKIDDVNYFSCILSVFLGGTLKLSLIILTFYKLILPAALMYVLVPMPCLFFGGGSTQFLTSRDGGGLVFHNLTSFHITILNCV